MSKEFDINKQKNYTKSLQSLKPDKKKSAIYLFSHNLLQVLSIAPDKKEDKQEEQAKVFSTRQMK